APGAPGTRRRPGRRAAPRHRPPLAPRRRSGPPLSPVSQHGRFPAGLLEARVIGKPPAAVARRDRRRPRTPPAGPWGRDDPTLAASLATHARRLRAELRADRTAAPAFATLRGFGYRIGEDLRPA